MAEQQKIHPTDVEAPSTPLVQHEFPRSENGDPADRAHAMQQHPAHHPTRTDLKPPKKRACYRCCCWCLCWSVYLFLFSLVLIAATAGILYLVFQPKVPKYSVDNLRVTAFSINLRLNAQASFAMMVTAKNPNKRIGIFYEENSHLSVWYTDTRLCTGSLPAFYQGPCNTTVLTVVLAGQTQMGSDLLTALQAQQQTGMVPLIFKGDVPVRVKFGRLKLWKVRFIVSCDLVVDSLTVGNKIRIKTSSCKFKLRL